jgi:putative chitinase
MTTPPSTPLISTAVVRTLVPSIGAEAAVRWASALEAARGVAGITTARQAGHWLGQILHESSGLRVFEENLGYSAERLMQVWPGRFPTLASAQPFARNPQALANKVYNGRMGNREGSNDGWHFRGRGPKQLTGRDNYTAFAAWLNREAGDPVDIRTQPELVSGAHYGALSAAWFWHARGLNRILAAQSDEARACEAVTRTINGGRIGYAGRWDWTRRALRALG